MALALHPLMLQRARAATQASVGAQHLTTMPAQLQTSTYIVQELKVLRATLDSVLEDVRKFKGLLAESDTRQEVGAELCSVHVLCKRSAVRC